MAVSTGRVVKAVSKGLAKRGAATSRGKFKAGDARSGVKSYLSSAVKRGAVTAGQAKAAGRRKSLGGSGG